MLPQRDTTGHQEGGVTPCVEMHMGCRRNRLLRAGCGRREAGAFTLPALGRERGEAGETPARVVQKQWGRDEMHPQSASGGESHMVDEITQRESIEGSEKTFQTRS